MQSSLRSVSQLYLTFIPFIAAIIAFAVGHVSYKLYVPVWIGHSILMILATWFLGARAIRSADETRKTFAGAALLLISPWVLFTVFTGMGPPPDTAAGWVASATEQQVRYMLLIGGGVLAAMGFALLNNSLQTVGEKFYSLLGFTAISVAIPLFMINMAFWGSFLSEAFRIFENSHLKNRPDWYFPIRALFATISLVETGLIYLATAAFAASLRRAGWMAPTASHTYILISLLGMGLNLVPSSFPEPFATLGYLVSIPAFPFIMPYLMAINLLRRLGND